MHPALTEQLMILRQRELKARAARYTDRLGAGTQGHPRRLRRGWWRSRWEKFAASAVNARHRAGGPVPRKLTGPRPRVGRQPVEGLQSEPS
jgi:hypothetical protein